MPQDFRLTYLKQLRERSERKKQAEVESLMASGGSIHDKYVLLWNQQMERCVIGTFLFELHFSLQRFAVNDGVVAEKEYSIYGIDMMIVTFLSYLFTPYF